METALLKTIRANNELMQIVKHAGLAKKEFIENDSQAGLYKLLENALPYIGPNEQKELLGTMLMRYTLSGIGEQDFARELLGFVGSGYVVNNLELQWKMAVQFLGTEYWLSTSCAAIRAINRLLRLGPVPNCIQENWRDKLRLVQESAPNCDEVTEAIARIA